ncbi:hypothetical protein HY227_00315 [Candidatus Wolfebacteria bacterium]|nr:hypothetical protein [Candidatus Wolfebacteria bacterium]
MAKTPVKNFSHRPESPVKQPFLAEAQMASWDWFVKKGLKSLFEEISPIKDYTGKELELYFSDYYFDEPKYNEETARFKDLSYEAPLRAKVKLVNRRTKDEKEQEVYLGDFPIMTKRGTFVINGVERTVVSQLIRSPGVYFTTEMSRGRKLFGAKVIPNRGCWLEFITDLDGSIGVKIDRHRKASASELLRIFGLDDKDLMIKTFKDVDAGSVKYIEATLKKDPAETTLQSYSEIYKRLRPGDLATPENAKSLIDAMLWRSDRYSLSPVGRFKLNQRLGITSKKNKELLDLEDVILIIKEIIRLNNDSSAEPDDIDHLGNRRVRAVGELLQNRLYVGFARLRRNIQDRMSTQDPELLSPLQLINARPLVAVQED